MVIRIALRVIITMGQQIVKKYYTGAKILPVMNLRHIQI
jgi:hypothetical protein